MDWTLVFRNCMTIISVLGIIVELVFFLLLYSTRKERTLTGHALFLAPNSIFELVFLLSWAPFRVDLLIEHGYVIFGITIFDFETSPYLTKLIFLTLTYTCNVALSVLSIPFYLRYALICKRQRISRPGKILLYCIALLINFIVAGILYYSCEVSPTVLQYLQKKPDMSGEYWNFAAAYVLSASFAIACIIVCGNLIINYLLIVYFNYQVLQYLKREQMHPSELKTYRNLQVSMIIQCVVQSLTLLLPFNAFILGAYLNLSYASVFFVIFNSAPLLTTLCTMFSIPEYRGKFSHWYNELVDLIMFT